MHMPTETTAFYPPLTDDERANAWAAFFAGKQWKRPSPPEIGQASALEQIKLLALTAGSSGELSTSLALSRIVRLCIDAGVKAHLAELKELHHGN
jgi:hypothetical protein